MPIVAKKTPASPIPQEAAPPQHRIRHKAETLLQGASERVAEIDQTADAAPAPRRRGVAKKDENGKYLPCEAPVGFANPPKSGQFQKGNRGGGRTRGARSQDSIRREKLQHKEIVTIDGKKRELSRRELAEELRHKKAFENGGNPKLLTELSNEAARLFPDASNDNGKSSFFGDPAMDDQLLRSVFAVFQMGEPSPDGFDPAIMAGTPIADFTGSGDSNGWNEDEWQPSRDAPDGADDAEDGND